MKKLIFLIALFPASLYAQVINTFIPPASLDGPEQLARDRSGNIYAAQADGNNVLKISPTGLVTVIAGTGVTGYGGDGGPATAAMFNQCTGIALDTAGNIYVVDNGNNVVRKINTAGIISNFAGGGPGPTRSAGYTGDGGLADTARLFFPIAVATDSSGNVYIADGANNVVRKVNDAGIISTFAGNGFGAGIFTGAYIGDGGPATAAELTVPFAVEMHNGTVYISDGSNNVLRAVNASGIISTIAGTGFGSGGLGIGGYTGDGGPATAAEIFDPQIGIIFNDMGDLFFSDAINNVIRKINTAGIITTYAGNGADAGTGFGFYSGDGSQADSAELTRPTGMVIDHAGNIIFSDAFNNAIRKISGISGMQFICTGDSVQLAANATGGVWMSASSAIASVSAAGRVKGISGGATTIWYIAGGDTAAAAITVNAAPYAGIITGSDSVCLGSPIGQSDTIAGGYWEPSHTGPTVGSGTTDTLIYIIPYTCGVATAMFPVYIVNNDPGDVVGPDTVCVGDTVFLSETAAGGSWTLLDSTMASLAAPGEVVGMMPGEDFVIYTKSGPVPDCVRARYFTLEVIPASSPGCPVRDTTALSGVHPMNRNANIVSIFPNPTHTALTISCSSMVETVVITNIISQVVYSNVYDAPQAIINVTDLTPGIYFIEINGMVVKRFVKE